MKATEGMENKNEEISHKVEKKGKYGKLEFHARRNSVSINRRSKNGKNKK